MFDRPYVDPSIAEEQLMKPESMAAALQASRESLVLLKNEKDALPLKKNVKKVLVCGPNADEKSYARSRYGPSNEPVTTVLDGIKAKLQTSGAQVVCAKGCDHVDPHFPESELIPEKISTVMTRILE